MGEEKSFLWKDKEREKSLLTKVISQCEQLFSFFKKFILFFEVAYINNMRGFHYNSHTCIQCTLNMSNY
jgi:hypothetical protein